ncbi:MAG: carboxylate-amine ligase [Gemmatimonadota bacterium]
MVGFTVGVEEEYQLVDPVTGALVSRAGEVRAADPTGVVRAEIQATMLEVGTRPCRSVDALAAELSRVRAHARLAAARVDLAVAVAGLHPFSRWVDHHATDDARCRRLLARYRHVLRSEHVFGMHVHVAVPAGVDRIDVINRLRRYVPHLVALSASSPFFEGEDTGYASYRTVVAGRLPCSGLPPRCESERQHRALVRALVRSGVMEDARTSYWDIRPHPVHRTVEVRCPDACPRVADAVALAALVRALVAAAVERRVPAAGSGELPGTVEDAILAGDRWHAARYGLDARLTDPDALGAVPARTAVRRLLDRIRPAAAALGDAEALTGISELLARGNAADRMRRHRSTGADWREIVRWLVHRSAVPGRPDHGTADVAA